MDATGCIVEGAKKDDVSRWVDATKADASVVRWWGVLSHSSGQKFTGIVIWPKSEPVSCRYCSTGRFPRHLKHSKIGSVNGLVLPMVALDHRGDITEAKGL